MATKKISELTKVTSVQDTDLLIVETSGGTRSVKKSDLVSRTPTKLSELTDDSTHRLVTDTEKTTWNAKQSQIKTGSITLNTSSWSGSGKIYTQTVAISNGTSVSKIDLQPNSTVLNQLISDKVSAIYIENNNGTFKAYAIGAKPTVNLTVQFTRTEVN